MHVRNERSDMRLLAILCLFAGLLAGCEKDESNKVNARTITCPESWQEQELALAGFEGTSYLSPIENAVSDDFRENVSMIFEEIPPSLAWSEYIALSKTNLGRQLNNLEIIGQREKPIGPYRATIIDLAHQQGVYSLRVRTFFVQADKGAYIITCTAGNDTFEAFESQFEQIADTFQ